MKEYPRSLSEYRDSASTMILQLLEVKTRDNVRKCRPLPKFLDNDSTGDGERNTGHSAYS